MKTLVMCSKHSQSNIKHLTNNLLGLVDGVTDTNFDSKSALHELKDMMDLNDCDSVLYFECTKRAVGLWISTLKGPTIKLRIEELVDMRYFDGTVFIENGTLLAFSDDFENGNLKIFKSLITKIFESDKPKDRIMSFFYDDGLIKIRVYKIDGVEEIGPRISASVFKIMELCFSGKILHSKAMALESEKIEVESNK